MGNVKWDWAAEARYLEQRAATANGEDQLSSLAQAGEHWASAGEYERAIRLLTDVAARTGDPHDAASTSLGYALLMAGREEEGQAVFRAAERLAAEAGDWREFHDIAGYLALAGRPEQALADFDAALDLVLALPDPHEPVSACSPVRTYSWVVSDRLKVREQLGRPADEHDRAALKDLSRLERWRRRRRRSRSRGQGESVHRHDADQRRAERAAAVPQLRAEESGRSVSEDQSDYRQSNDWVNDVSMQAVQALLGLVSQDVTAIGVLVEPERVELVFWTLRDTPELREDAQDAVFELDVLLVPDAPLIEYTITVGEPDLASLRQRNSRMIYWAKDRVTQP